MKLSLVVVVVVAALGANVRTASGREVPSTGRFVEPDPVYRGINSTHDQAMRYFFYELAGAEHHGLRQRLGKLEALYASGMADTAVQAAVQAAVGAGLVSSGAAAVEAAVEAAGAGTEHATVEAFVRHAVEVAMDAALQEGRQPRVNATAVWLEVLGGVCRGDDAGAPRAACLARAIKPAPQRAMQLVWERSTHLRVEDAADAAEEAVDKLAVGHDAQTAAKAKAAARASSTVAARAYLKGVDVALLLSSPSCTPWALPL